MDTDTLYRLLSSIWVVWLTAVFVGIVVWVMWPRRKAAFEEHGRIPFHDDP